MLGTWASDNSESSFSFYSIAPPSHASSTLERRHLAVRILYMLRMKRPVVYEWLLSLAIEMIRFDFTAACASLDSFTWPKRSYR